MKEQLSLFVIQAEMPRGMIGKASLPIEGRDGVGMFKMEEQTNQRGLELENANTCSNAGTPGDPCGERI